MLKQDTADDDLQSVSTTSLEPATTTPTSTGAGDPTEASSGAPTPCVWRLRRDRHDVVAELSRCRYLLRLVRARTDLLVASALGPIEGDADGAGHDGWTGGGCPAPTPGEVETLVLQPYPNGIVEHLEALTDAGRRLALHEKHLAERLDDATGALVGALRANPGAALSR